MRTFRQGRGSQSALGATDDRHQFLDLAALLRLVAGRNGVFDAMADVVAKNFLFEPAQRGADRGDLRHDVDAVAILFDHAGKSADLSLDLRKALRA